MACHHPLRAWRTRSGEVRLNREVPDAAPLALPCGGCLGCRTANAKAWALRCQLELNDHDNAVVATLTYDEEHVPPTLRVRDVQLLNKRLRQQLRRKGRGKRRSAAQPIRLRHFTCGEYGETNGRPHYHALLYGPGQQHSDLIQSCWREERKDGKKILGHVHIDTVTPAAIAYVAGYVAKKLNHKLDDPEEIETGVDPETGEVLYTKWQKPFTIMSRNPGIGGNARKHTQSWRAYAIQHGKMIPVPKYLHEAWKQQATPEQLETLEYEKLQNRIRKTPITPAQLEAAEKIAVAVQREKAARRRM